VGPKSAFGIAVTWEDVRVQRVGSRREETRIWTRTSRRRARVGKSRDGFPSSSSGPDKFEGSDLDGAGESGDGDDESVELDPK